jgi:hypothetical protein
MIKTLESRFVPNDWAVMEEPTGPTRIVKITQVMFGTDANRPTDLVVTCLCETEKGDWKSPQPVYESDLFNPTEWLRLKLAKNLEDARSIRRHGKIFAAMIERLETLAKKEVTQ